MNDVIPSARERILEAARALFLTQGFHGSNLRDIASSAQVSMGGIYHHFQSKLEIYEELLGSTRLGQELPRMAALFASKDFPDNLGAIGKAIFQLANTYRDDFKLIYLDILEFQGGHVKPLVAPLRATITEATRQLLAERMGRGEIADIHPAVISRCVVGLFLYFYLEDTMLDLSTSDETSLSEDQIADQMADLLMRGLLRDPSTPG